MKMLSLILMSLLITDSAYARRVATCSSFLSGFTKYEDEVNGQIKWFHNLTPIRNWDPNDQFDGVVLSRSMSKRGAAPVLEVVYRSASGDRVERQSYNLLLPFELDPRLKEFENFKPHEFFNFDEPGVFTLTLKSGSAVLCEQSGRYGIGH